MQMKRIIAGTSAIALSLSMTSFALAAEDNQSINLEVEVVDTLSMDCYDSNGAGVGDTTVTLGNSTTGAGLVTAGTPSIGASECVVTTNDDQGYYLTIERTTQDVTWSGGNGNGQYAAAGSVLIHQDPNTPATWYEIPDFTEYSYAALTAAGSTWSGTGLGFSVIDFPDTSLGNNDFSGVWVEGTYNDDVCVEGVGADLARYAGVPATAQAIAAVPEYSANSTTTQVCYKVDVDATQQSGEYAGQVTFTATSDASTFLQ
jgi:hypothetical protein